MEFRGHGVDGSGQLVASCVDGTAARGCNPPVTAVDLRPAAYGRSCAELLCDILVGRAAADTVRRHDWVLETRDSTLGTARDFPPRTA